MALTFRFFHDAALTSEINAANPLQFGHVVGASDPADKMIYVGSPEAGKKLQTKVNPGSDPVVSSIDDSNPGSGASAAEFKLALSSGGLDSATPGASLSLSATLYSGVGNKVTIYVRCLSALNTSNNYTDVAFRVSDVEESPV